MSPGTLYPLLARLEVLGWLDCKTDPDGGLRAKKEYVLTRKGKKALSFLKNQIEELHGEVVVGEGKEGPLHGL
ncbi:MAG: PadR family transcriptional regulator [Deltaproteobacteria bacterium]|nr:PadR family transcriptional regulator [Deltaproteobacteria bacterium]